LPEVICNTSPLQYLHQIGQLNILPALAGSIVVPPSVLVELKAGIEKGLDLPQLEKLKWVRIQAPISATAASLITDLGPGESQVLVERHNGIIGAAGLGKVQQTIWNDALEGLKYQHINTI
jgi:predicted nucleic acid-binding protein